MAVGYYASFIYLLAENSLKDEKLSKEEMNRSTSYLFLCLGISEFFSGLLAGKYSKLIINFFFRNIISI